MSTASPKKAPRDHRSRQKSRGVSEFCLPLPLKMTCATIEVDKNREKYLDFVYRIPQKWRARPRSRQKWSKKPEFCLPLSSKPRGLVSCQLGGAAKISLHAAHLHSALSKCSIASPLHPKALDFTKKEPPKIGRFLRCAAFIFFSVIRS